jgi:hypothetical protein
MYITYYIHISYTYNIYMYIIVSDNHHWAPGRLWSVVLTWSGKKKKKNWAQCPGRGDHTPQHYSMHGSVTHSNILFIDVYLPIILPYTACHPPLFCVVGTHLVLHRSNAACFIGLLAVDPLGLSRSCHFVPVGSQVLGTPTQSERAQEVCSQHQSSCSQISRYR